MDKRIRLTLYNRYTHLYIAWLKLIHVSKMGSSFLSSSQAAPKNEEQI